MWRSSRVRSATGQSSSPKTPSAVLTDLFLFILEYFSYFFTAIMKMIFSECKNIRKKNQFIYDRGADFMNCV